MEDRQIDTRDVKTRKPHICWGCLRSIQPGAIMTRQTQISDGKIGSIYWCQVCNIFIDELLEGEKICEGELKDGFLEEWEAVRYTLEVEGGVL